MAQEKKKHYNPNKCECRVRKGKINKKNGNSIIITGHHAHEWSVVISLDDNITEVTFSNRKAAYAEYKRKEKLIS